MIHNSAPLIISNNCWGGLVYKHLNMPYMTPFVGLYLYAPCYIQLLRHMTPFTFASLSESKTSRYRIDNTYPVGLINNSWEIHFVHYESWSEARDAWHRRSQRMFNSFDSGNIVMKFCDRDAYDGSLLDEFYSLPIGRKIFFSSACSPYPNHIQIFFEDTGDRMTPEGHVLFDLCRQNSDVMDWIIDPCKQLFNNSILVKSAKKLNV
jgi:uncharacterized protein (DUF1919 family)